MKRTALLIVLSFVAGMGAEFLRNKTTTRWVPHRVEEKEALRVVQEDRSKDWKGGLENFGIKSGDILVAVNGVSDPTMLQELVNGVNKGKTCVTYERDGSKREVCLEQKAN